MFWWLALSLGGSYIAGLLTMALPSSFFIAMANAIAGVILIGSIIGLFMTTLIFFIVILDIAAAYFIAMVDHL